MKRNMLNVKLFNKNRSAIKDNTFVDLRKDQIKNVVIGLSSGRNNNVDYAYYYFTFMMKDGERIDVDIKEGYKFMDLINKYHIKNDYLNCREKSYVKEIEDDIER